MEYVLGAVGGLLVGAIVAYLLASRKNRSFEADARREADGIKQRLLDEARSEVARTKAEYAEEQLNKRREFDKELKASLEDSRSVEKRLEKREELIDRKLQLLERREGDLTRKDQDLVKLEQKRQEQLREAEGKNAEMSGLIEEERHKLHTITGMTLDQARATLLQRVERDIATEVAEMTTRAINRAKENADGEARKVILNVIQRVTRQGRPQHPRLRESHRY